MKPAALKTRSLGRAAGVVIAGTSSLVVMDGLRARTSDAAQGVPAVYCAPGIASTCFSVGFSAAPDGAGGTEVTLRLSNVQGATGYPVPLPSPGPAWARLHHIEIVGPDDGTFAADDYMTGVALSLVNGATATGDSAMKWGVVPLVVVSGVSRGYALGTDITSGGAEIIGCAAPPDLDYPYFRTCASGGQQPEVILEFAARGVWTANQVKLTLVFQDPTGEWPCEISEVQVGPNDPFACERIGASPPTNAAPIANAGGPYSVNEGSAIAFNGSGSLDPNGDVLTFSWNFSDPPNGTGSNPTHTYIDNGSYPVTLTVSDGSLQASANTTAQVANVAPIVNAGPDITVNAGQQVIITGSFNDPGVNDAPWTSSLTWGAPNGPGFTTPPIHGQSFSAGPFAYPGPGTYTATVTVIDKDGGIGTDNALITVLAANVAPIARAGGPYSGIEGSSIAFDASSSSDPNGDALTYDWNFGDGSAHRTGSRPTHAYADNGAYVVTLVASDGKATHSATTSVTVSNAPPTGSLTNPFPVNEGSLFAIAVTNTGDPSSIDLGAGLKFSFDCGNGLGFGPYGTQRTRTCAAIQNRTQQVQARIRDKDGAVTPLTASGAILNVAPKATIVANGPTSIRKASVFGLRLTFRDPGLLDRPWRVTIDWGNGSESFNSILQLTQALRTRKYDQTGAYTIRATVRDTDGGSGVSNPLVVDVRP